MKSLLIIDDDPLVAQVIVEACALELPVDIEVAENGSKGIEKAEARKFDAIILDLTLPDMSGLDVCRGLRDKRILTPVICVTSRGEVIDRVLGLEMGADDYITKPFSPRELIARLKAVWRRARENTNGNALPEGGGEVIEIGDLRIENESHRVFLKGALIELSRTEFELLSLFANNPGKVFSRDELLEKVLGYEVGYEHSITSHISRLRIKLAEDPEMPRYLRTVRGIGYRFSSPDELVDVKEK